MDEPVLAGMQEQMRARASTLEDGAERRGWKIGFNVPAVQEKLGITESVVGHLTSATQLDDGDEFDAAGTTALTAEAEVALRIGPDGRRVDGYAVAIELVDLGKLGELEVSEIVATNIFHRAFLLGAFTEQLPSALEVTLKIGGDEVGTKPVEVDVEGTVELVLRHVEATGQAVAPGDVIISGAQLVNAVEPGQKVVVDMGDLGKLRVKTS